MCRIHGHLGSQWSVAALVFPFGLVVLRFTLCEGFGSGIVVATGTRTEFGVVFTMMQDVRLICIFHFSFEHRC